MTELRHIVYPFEPIIDEKCKVLILGSVPSVRSVEEGFYYMHPKNRFWPMMSRVIGHDLTSLDADGKRQALLGAHIGLYDAVYECDIANSQDAKAKNIVSADIAALIHATDVRRILCNGALSYQTLLRFNAELEPISLKLPSTSPANAAYSLDRLIEAWSAALKA